MKSQRFFPDPVASVCTAILMVLISVKIQAQDFVLNSAPTGDLQFGYRFIRPNVNMGERYSPVAGSHEFNGSFRISEKTYLQAVIPLGYYAQQGQDSDISLGNIYAGAQFKLGRQGLSRFSVGIYIPTAPSYDSENQMGNAMAMLSNIYNIERYTSESFSIYTNYAYVVNPGKGPLFTFEAGPSVVIPTGKSAAYREVELYLHYGIKGGFQWNTVVVWAELNGLLAATSGASSAGEATIHQIFFGGQFTGAVVRPGIFYGFSLDKEWNDFTESKGMLGVKVDVVLNKGTKM